MPKRNGNVLAIMLGGKKGKPSRNGNAQPIENDYEEDEYAENDYGEGFQESASAAMSAIESGDSEGFASALKDAIVTCLEEQGLE